MTSLFGLTLTLDPEWRRTDQESGRYNDNFAVTAALLIDKEVIPETFFIELNLVYSPSFMPLAGRWLRFNALVGGSYVITPAILVGTEIRHENLAPSVSPNAHALFAGRTCSCSSLIGLPPRSPGLSSFPTWRHVTPILRILAAMRPIADRLRVLAELLAQDAGGIQPHRYHSVSSFTAWARCSSSSFWR